MRWLDRVTGEDVERWRAAGWVTTAGAAGIRAEMAARPPLVTPAAALAVLAAALLCFGASAFVAANWSAIPRPVKLGLFIGALWVVYAVAATAMIRGLGALGQAALVLAIGLFGASVMLTGQMYHLSGPPTDALLLWTGGAALTAAMFRSKPALAFTAGLTLLWAEWSAFQAWTAFWPFLPAWALVAVLCWRERWGAGAHLIALGLGYWAFVLGFRFGEPSLSGAAHNVIGALCVTLAGAMMALDRHPPAALPGAARERLPMIAGYAFALAAASLLTGQAFAEDAAFAPLAAAGLATMAGALWLGAQADRTGVIWLAALALAGELMMIYVRTVGTLLGSAAFFAVSGVITGAAALVAWRLSRRNRAPEPAQGAATEIAEQTAPETRT